MKIICLQENLKKVLNITSSIIGRSLTLPVLNNILFEAKQGKIKISATNLEIGVSAGITGKIEKEGKITIPAKTITSIINNLSNKKIELEVKKNKIQIKSAGYRAEINGLPAEEFPIIPQATQKPLEKISNSKLKDVLASVVSMTAVSDSRPEITGVLLAIDRAGMRVAATDSFRLAEKKLTRLEKDVAGEVKYIIPQRTIQEVIKILGEHSQSETKIIFENNQIFLETDHVWVVSRLIDGNYPDYQQIIPQQTNFLFKLDKDELIANIRLAGVFSSRVNEVKLIFNQKNKKLLIISADPDLGANQAEIPFEIEKKEGTKDKLEINFNHRFLLEGLTNIAGKKVIFGLNGETAPGVLKSATDNSYLYLLMPIKTN